MPLFTVSNKLKKKQHEIRHKTHNICGARAAMYADN